MARQRKSPQKKKQLEYTKDHFTFGWRSSRAFPKRWKRKKTNANRAYRSKSEQLLAQVKPGSTIEEAQDIADDLTAAHFQMSVSRKRLYKTGTVTVGEKVRRKLERRAEDIGRKVIRRELEDRHAALAVDTLTSLEGEELADAVRRAGRLCERNQDELGRILTSKRAVDRALYFVYLIAAGSVFERDALRRNPQLAKRFDAWAAKANRMIQREERAQTRKLAEKQAVKNKWKTLRKSQALP